MIAAAPLPPTEGIGYYVTNLSAQLVARGHEVTIVTRGSAAGNRLVRLGGIPVWYVTFLPVYPLHVWFHGLFVQRLVSRIAAGFDLVHYHSPLVPWVRSNLPAIVTVHTNMRVGAKTIPEKSLFGRIVKMQLPMSIYHEAELFRRANRRVATSRSIAEELRGYQISPERVGVPGNGVDAGLFRPGDSEPEGPDGDLFTVSRLDQGKGLEDLLECAKIVVRARPQVRFLVAGRGRLEGELLKKVGASGLEANFVLLGQIRDRHVLVQHYQKATAYIHPSHYEGLPTSMLEAMACAKVCIAYDVSGCRDLISDGRNGFLVPDHRPDLLAERVLGLLDHPDRHRILGTMARKMVEETYTWDAVTDRYCAEYRRLLDRQEGSSLK